MEIAGYLAAVLIGVSLGLIGGGGSILTVPVFVYLLHADPVLAAMYSLFVVGSCSLVGSVRSYYKKLINFQVVAYFGLPSLLSVFIVRLFVFPLIPDHLFTIGELVVDRRVFLMVLFALLMLVAAGSMIKNGTKPQASVSSNNKKRKSGLLVQGLLVGAVTGLLGAGGGFLIIPSLVLISRLPMKIAVGTSLTIMAISSYFGFFITLSHYTINWPQLLLFTAIAVAGVFLGTAFSDKVPGQVLKKGFGWFVLAIGLFILVNELFF